MSWWTPLTDSPYNAEFRAELIQPAIMAARLAHQWLPVKPNASSGDQPFAGNYPMPQRIGQGITQVTYQRAVDGSVTNAPNGYPKPSAVSSDQAAFLKLMGPYLLGAP